MTEDLATQAVEWTLNQSKNRPVVFNLFGGEPLVNQKTTEKIVDYIVARSLSSDQELSVVLSTNGTIDFVPIGRLMHAVHHWIVVSIDGASSLHNHNRPFRNGDGSYQTVSGNIRKYIAAHGPSMISARAIWRRGQTDLVESVESILALGLRHVSIGRETGTPGKSFQPINWGPVSDFDEMFAAYDELADWYVAALNRGANIVVQPLHSIMCALLRSRVTRSRCAAGISKWCITPDGSVYPCHRFVGDDRFSIGSIYAEPLNVRLPTVLADTSLPHYCDGCWVRYWCFSDMCTYLSPNEMDFRRLDGFCEHMRGFIEMVCFHITNLSKDGRQTLLTT
jgi:uncharacterized protein